MKSIYTMNAKWKTKEHKWTCEVITNGHRPVWYSVSIHKDGQLELRFGWYKVNVEIQDAIEHIIRSKNENTTKIS